MRIHFPTGQDYTVICDKRVKHIDVEQGSLFVELTEEEILKYSSAKEDKNLYFGTELYMTKQSEKMVEVANTIIDLTGRTNLDDLYRYDEYPVNPNTQILSRVYNYDLDLLQARVELDESLSEFFDQDDIRYSYILKEKSLVVTEEVIEDELQPLSQTNGTNVAKNPRQDNGQTDGQEDENREVDYDETKEDGTKEDGTKDDKTKGDDTKDDGTKDDETKDDETKDDGTKEDVTVEDKTKEDVTVDFDF